jgi:hypothetical protein
VSRIKTIKIKFLQEYLSPETNGFERIFKDYSNNLDNGQ